MATERTGWDGEPLQAGDTYHSLETLSEEPSPPAPTEGELAASVTLESPPAREVPSRRGLPLTEAMGKALDRLERLEKRTRALEVRNAVLTGALAAMLACDALRLALAALRLGLGL